MIEAKHYKYCMLSKTSINQKIYKSIATFCFTIVCIILLLVCGFILKNDTTNFLIGEETILHRNFLCIIILAVILFDFLRQNILTKSKICFIIYGLAITIALASDIYLYVVYKVHHSQITTKLMVLISYLASCIISFTRWLYIKYSYEENFTANINIEKVLMIIVFFISCIISILDAIFGFCCQVDINGGYVTIQSGEYILTSIHIIMAIILVVTIIKLKCSIKEKIILSTYIVPLIITFLFGLFSDNDLSLFAPFQVVIYIFIFCNFVVEKEKESIKMETTLEGKNKELDIASKIQTSMLPTNFSDYEKYGIDIFAFMNAAKEVGGDFYDYFMIDEDRMAVIIADVSDKGVPAALFMAKAKVLLSKVIMEAKTLSEAISSVHKSILENNDNSMFITLFAGVIDFKNNMITYTNAGHCPPILKKKGENAKFLDDVHGSFLGCKLFKEINYKESIITFEKGDMLFLYTDGVTEAQNNKNELYGNEKLLKCIDDIKSFETKQIVEDVVKNVKEYAREQLQTDDITILCVRLDT